MDTRTPGSNRVKFIRPIPRDLGPLLPAKEADLAAQVEAICAPHRHEEVVEGED